MKRWIRVVLPSEVYILAACATYLFVSGSALLIDMGRRANARPAEASIAGLLVLTACAFSYGVQRVRNFHPACQAEYRNWIRYTPWKEGLPLPLGPVHLVVQDLLIVGLMTALSSLHKGFEWYIVPSSFLVGYLATMMFPLVLTRQYLPAYLIIVGLGGALYLHQSPLGLTIMLAVLYSIAWAGQRESLREMDQWEMSFYDERIAPHFDPQGFQESNRSHILGWPFDRLNPHRNPFEMNWKFSLALAFLAGWWWFVLIDVTGSFGGKTVTGIGLPFGGALALGRIWTYCWGYVPPLSFWARILRFRWIIPGYDVVFVAPILMLSWVVMTIWMEQGGLNLDSLIAGPLQMSGLILIDAFCPPSLDSWRLTGNHRIVPATSQNIGELQETK